MNRAAIVSHRRRLAAYPAIIAVFAAQAERLLISGDLSLNMISSCFFHRRRIFGMDMFRPILPVFIKLSWQIAENRLAAVREITSTYLEVIIPDSVVRPFDHQLPALVLLPLPTGADDCIAGKDENQQTANRRRCTVQIPPHPIFGQRRIRINSHLHYQWIVRHQPVTEVARDAG